MDPLLRAPERAGEPPPAGAGLPGGGRAPRVVWERAADLAVEVFRLAEKERRLEPALRAPLRTAALAVPTCLARGIGRRGGDMKAQLILALGALAEIESHLALAVRLRGEALEGVAPLRGRIELVRRLIVRLGAGERQPPPEASRLDSQQAIR